MNENADGYFVIVLPDEDVWQGFFLDPAFDFRAGRYVESLDARLDSLGAAISSGEVYSHLSNRDQAIVGLLSALVADYFSKLDLPQMTLAASGIARVSGYSFFWIEGGDYPMETTTRSWESSKRKQCWMHSLRSSAFHLFTP